MRRTKSRFGARLEPFTPRRPAAATTGRNLDIVTQAETIAPYGERSPPTTPLHRRHGDARDGRAAHRRGARDRRCGSTCCWSAALRALAERRARPAAGAGRLPAARRWRWPAGRRRSTSARGAAPPGPHAAFAVARRRVGLRRRCRPAGRGAPAAGDAGADAALLRGDWATPTRASRAHRREGSGLVAAYLQWHLERGLPLAAARGARHRAGRWPER